MGDVVSSMWRNGTPKPPDALQPLAGWSREDLIEAVAAFRKKGQMAVKFPAFAQILGSNCSEKQAQGMWKALGGKDGGSLDFLSVLLSMVVMSNQKFISRVTFLFSVADFNSSGSISKSEFYIGMRALFKGLVKFFPSSLPPSSGDLERATNKVFEKMDADQSGSIDLEEVLIFAYRSKGLRQMFGVFPSSDERVFEELVLFNGETVQRQESSADSAKKEGKVAMRSKLALAPDPTPSGGGGGKKKCQVLRPWKQPTIVTKARAYMVWCLFDSLLEPDKFGGAEFKVKKLTDLIEEEAKLQEELARFASRLDDEGLKDKDKTAEARAVRYMHAHLTSESSKNKLAEYEPDDMLSLRGMLAVLWTNVEEREIQQGIQWCRKYQAHMALHELCKTKESALTNADYDPSQHAMELDVTQDDIQAIFDVLDTNGDGKLTMDELVGDGSIDDKQAAHLQRLWDRDRDGELTKGDMLSIILGMNQMVRRELKGLFASHAMR